MKCRKMIKKAICIFLSVVILFFSINNSYLSPHKMDTVHATGAVIAGGVAITAEVIIELIAAICVTALGAAIIDDVVDWDWNAICNDVHDWCRDNVDILDQYVTDGTSALKEWALADEWVVIEGGGGSPDPSPSPDDDNNKDYSEKVWGTSDIWTIGNLIAGAGVLGSEFYNKVVSPDEGILEVAKRYVHDKVNKFQSSTASDPITKSLQETYVLASYNGFTYDDYGNINFYYHWMQDVSSNPYYYFDYIEWEFNGTKSSYYKYYILYSEGASSYPIYAFITSDLDKANYSSSYIQISAGQIEATRTYLYSDGSVYKTDTAKITSVSSDATFQGFPMFSSSEDAWNYFKGDETVKPMNGKNNYIDTDDEYGWASTADLTPADLLAANPALANNLIGKDVSISSLVAAINALKQQLEDQNPNTSTGGSSANPLPYPDVPTYSAIVNNVVTDPDVFPSTGTSTDPGTDPGTSTDPGTDTGINYSGLLGTIIGLLQQILQAIKDFMAWFVIDFPAIKAHLLEALDSVPGADGLDPFLAIITDIKGQITDHYDYPKITIQTPEILVQFVKAPEIVLLDFKDYAEYFIWVRTAMAFAILFGFAMWCVHDIKVELTLN